VSGKYGEMVGTLRRSNIAARDIPPEMNEVRDFASNLFQP
jgi:hypothetical protein